MRKCRQNCFSLRYFKVYSTDDCPRRERKANLRSENRSPHSDLIIKCL